ncbi:hypothetical protein CNX70_00355 [Janthinobacterium svalbardensis]|uniref:Uncharacterized protein n=2 Tax=Janthinobacterium svalbardensis TaxID=368607 RepID=A0A290WPN1_9BURK|nr:hypothetical protein CNX70_00355 [Janthinobacterium svalbardensis]
MQIGQETLTMPCCKNQRSRCSYDNNTRGETVTIARAGQRFTWHVQTFNHQTTFALSEIAPQDMPVDGVQVYVAANPLYAGS